MEAESPTEMANLSKQMLLESLSPHDLILIDIGIF